MFQPQRVSSASGVNPVLVYRTSMTNGTVMT